MRNQLSSNEMRNTVILQSTQLATAFLSFSASSLMALMISTKSDGLSDPLRRIIFAMSCADISSSLGFFSGPFLVPRDAVLYTIGGPSGNTATCDLNGFLFILGSTAAPMYTCALCIYYLFKINRNMPDEEFAARIEKKMHALILLWSVGGAFLALFTKSINAVPGGDFCYIEEEPGCYDRRTGSCGRGQYHVFYALAVGYLPNLLSFIGVTFAMVLICFTVFSQERMDENNRFLGRLRWRMTDHPVLGTSAVLTEVRNTRFLRRASSRASLQRHSRNEINARERKRQAVIQASLYILVYILVYIWPYIFFIFEIQSKVIPFQISVLLYIFYPLAGLLNMLVYTRLQVLSLRRRHPEYYWLQAFWGVVKAGGECPAPSNTNRDSFRATRQPNIEQIDSNDSLRGNLVELGKISREMGQQEHIDGENGKQEDLEEMAQSVDENRKNDVESLMPLEINEDGVDEGLHTHED